MTRVGLLVGPRHSARRDRIDSLLVERWGQALLLVPSQRQAQQRCESLLLQNSLPGFWGTPVQTFESFVSSLLRFEGLFAKPLDEFERRILLERAVTTLRAQGKLESLGTLATGRGFLNHALKTIVHLKQAAIEPPVFRSRVAMRQRPSPLDTCVADVYEAYQQALIEAGAYDRIGMYWTACDIASERRPKALEGLNALLLDSFDDFTPSEFRLLEILAPHLDALFFGLNGDMQDPSRRDLYAVPLQTAATLQARFNDVTVENFPARLPDTTSQYAAQELFWRNAPEQPEPLHSNVSFHVYADPTQEVENVCRRVKALCLNDGVPLDRIAVVYRSLDDTAQTLRLTLNEFGIPFTMQTRVNLPHSGVGAAIITLLDALARWDRKDVADVLMSRWFTLSGTDDAMARDLLPTATRLAGILEGRTTWHDSLARLASSWNTRSDPEMTKLKRHFPRMLEAIDWALQALGVLEEIDDSLPTEETFARFADAFVAILDRACLPEHFASLCDTETCASEQAAYAEVYLTLARLATWYDASTCVPRTHFISVLRQALNEASYRPPAVANGVSCLDAEGIRHLDFDHVFFCGANEGRLPKPPPANAIYSEDDLADLREAGILVKGKEEHSRSEMLLFHHVVASAQQHLYVTWSLLGTDGKPLLPSPFVRDLRDLLPEIENPTECDGPTPSPERIASPRDVRNAAFDTAPELRSLFPEETRWAERGGLVATLRDGPTPFDAFDGILSMDTAIHSLANEYGGDHLFSVDQLETYAACPFRFFAQRILDVPEVEEPEAAFDSRTRGQIMHEALRLFHERFVGKAVEEIDEVTAQHAIQEACTTAFEQLAWRSPNAPQGVKRAERARTVESLKRYVHIEHGVQQAGWKPTHFEVSFGRAPRESESSLNRTEPFVLETEKNSVLLSGRIDRIDVQANEPSARIVDYKSSLHVTSASIEAGISLQLALYALALEEFLLPGYTCAEARYLCPGKDRRRESLEALARAKPDKWEQRKAAALEATDRYIAGIREGKFPPVPVKDACTFCRARAACRYEEWRTERKLTGKAPCR